MPSPKKDESKQDYLKRCTKELIESEGREADQAYKLCNLYWDDAKSQRSILTLSAPLEMAGGDSAAADEKRQFMITAYIGKPLQTWFGQVIFDLAGMKSKPTFPVLREHQRDRVVGYGKSFKDEKNFYVEGEFSQATQDAKEVLDLADEGYPWQASVAIWPLKIKVLENAKAKETVNGREIQGPAEIWLESDIGEVSFVSLGRDDDTAAITLTESAGKVPVEIEIMQEEEIMQITLEILEKEAPDLLKQIQDDSYKKGLEEGKNLGSEAERNRVIEIMDADADPAETKKIIAEGVPADSAYKRFYEAEKNKRAQGLKEMESEATDPQGQEAPADPPEKDKRQPHIILAEKARILARKEKISLAEAQKRIFAEDPELASAWTPQQPE